MTNKKRKGFTIVELVIVIAVVAILAGVLIPTFAGVIEKANQSTDIQAVRQMNVLLKAESVDKTLEFNDVIEIVSKAGYDTEEKRTPKSKDHGFYWHSEENLIVLVKGTSELIYPNDNETLNQFFEENTIENNDNFKNLAVEGTTGGNSEGIKTAEALKAALEAGGTFKLGADITITKVEEAFVISNKIESTLDLNTHTLTIAAPEDEEKVFQNEILGKLTITDSSNVPGKIVIESSSAVNAYPARGGLVANGGTLNINNVNVEGYRDLNVWNDNNGEINLTNTVYTVIGGHGIKNDEGEAVITDSQFIAAGTGVCSVYSSSILEINGTDFTEKEGVGVTYHANDKSPIYIHQTDYQNSKATLTDVNVQVANTDTYSSVYTVGECSVTINSGDFDGTIHLDNYTTLFLNGGKFEKGTAYVDFTKGVYSSNGVQNEELISVGTIDAINQIISTYYKNIGAADAAKDYYNIIATKNNETQKTTYALIYQHKMLYPYSTTNDNKKLFGGDLTIDDNEVVTMYINDQGFSIGNDFEVYGTLNVVCGDIRPGDTKNMKGNIIVKSGGVLNISGNVEFGDNGKLDYGKFKTFVLNAVKVEGGTFKYNGQTVTIDTSNNKVFLDGEEKIKDE